MKYTPKYFYDAIPEWKRKKDSTCCRYIHRPISFVFTSIAANLGISANTISYISAIVALASCASFLFGNLYANIIAIFLYNLWVILDCVDGNLARTIRKQPFGEFADSISSYILVGFSGAAIGYAAYVEGGLLFESGNAWIIIIGAIGSSADTMMRLIFQKYKATELKMVKLGVMEPIEDVHDDSTNYSNWKIRIESEFGLGFIAIMLIPAMIFHALDVIVLYYILYYGGACVVSSLTYIRRAIKVQVECADKMPQE